MNLNMYRGLRVSSLYDSLNYANECSACDSVNVIEIDSGIDSMLGSRNRYYKCNSCGNVIMVTQSQMLTRHT